MTPMGWEETARSGLLQSWNPKNSGAFRKNSYPGVGGRPPPLPFCLCSTFRLSQGGWKKLKISRSPEKSPLGRRPGGGDSSLDPANRSTLKVHRLATRGPSNSEVSCSWEDSPNSGWTRCTPTRAYIVGRTSMLRTVEEASPHRVTTAIGVWISLPGRSRCSSWVQRRGQYIITQTPTRAMNAPATSARSGRSPSIPQPQRRDSTMKNPPYTA